MSIIISALSQGLLWAILAIGVYLSYRFLNISDLTSEGSFTLGAAVCASSIVNGLSPICSTLLDYIYLFVKSWYICINLLTVSVSVNQCVLPFSL